MRFKKDIMILRRARKSLARSLNVELRRHHLAGLSSVKGGMLLRLEHYIGRLCDFVLGQCSQEAWYKTLNSPYYIMEPKEVRKYKQITEKKLLDFIRRKGTLHGRQAAAAIHRVLHDDHKAFATSLMARKRLQKKGISVSDPRYESLYWDEAASINPVFMAHHGSLGCEKAFQHSGQRESAWLVKYKFVKPHDKVLDIGCGVGRVMKHLQGHVAELHGVDFSRKMIFLAKKRLRGSGVCLHQNNGKDLSMFEDNTFDSAYSFWVFHNITGLKTLKGYFREVERVLKPQGIFVLQVYDKGSMKKALRNSGLKVTKEIVLSRLRDRLLDNDDGRLMIMRKP